MVLSLITLAATVPLLATSTMQLSDQANEKSKEGQQEIKTRKSRLAVRASARMSEKRKQQLADKVVVLKDGCLVLDDHQSSANCHSFTGYFLPFPEKDWDGLVTTINQENFLNWVYIDASTNQVKHGIRAEAQSQLTGPMDLRLCKNGEQRLTFEGWEGFVVVKEAPGLWALYFDEADDGLRDKAHGKAVVEVELIRMELDDYQPKEIQHDADDH
jgi:hypothetical protein